MGGKMGCGAVCVGARGLYIEREREREGGKKEDVKGERDV